MSLITFYIIASLVYFDRLCSLKPSNDFLKQMYVQILILCVKQCMKFRIYNNYLSYVSKVLNAHIFNTKVWEASEENVGKKNCNVGVKKHQTGSRI